MVAEPPALARAPFASPPLSALAPTDTREGATGVHRFAFVLHPLELGFIHRDPASRWTRFLPDALVEELAAWAPPRLLARVTGGRSRATGQRVEGDLYTLGATPRKLLQHSPRFTYRRLHQAARMAEEKGARILGLGAFTKVVGDAGVTVAREAGIAVTTGNSLTVAVTLEAAKQAVRRMGGADLTRGRAMVVGATGSIGSACARLLAQAIRDVVLVSIEPERLLALERRIRAETPGARVATATRADELLGDCGLVVTATSAFGERVVDLSRCQPGAVLVDVALPSDIQAAEAAARPDLLVIEGGEVVVPGEVDFGYDFGLPPGVTYACMAEPVLLAMEGRFESFTLGRDIAIERVKEIYRLFRKHGFALAGLRSFGRYLTDEDLAAKRALAERLRADPALFARVQTEAAARIAALPPRSKGVLARA
jgi:predicted amino acid dehydrogenase